MPEEQAREHHHPKSQLLFISSIGRRDIQTAILFLITRARKPYKDDRNKLKCLLKYLKSTKHMRLKLSVEILSFIQWWVDASYLTHTNCKGYTGAMM